jgi:TldD protein
VGIGIRVLAYGCWGFAATDDLTRAASNPPRPWRSEIARSGTAARKQEVTLAPERKYEATWVSPFQIDPFSIPVDRNLGVLLAVDAELRRQPGVSLAEASMHFERRRQGLRIHAGESHRPDPLPQRRRFCGPQL